jgi:flagellar motor switch protein FliM
VTAATIARAVDEIKLGTANTLQPDFPGLNPVGVKVARGLSASCGALGGTTRFNCNGLHTLTLGEWTAGLSPSVAVARFRDRTIRGGLLVSIPPRFMAALVDLFYGGDGAVDPSAAALGSASQRLFERFAAGAAEALAAGWADVQPLAPVLVAASFAAEDVTLGKSGDLVVVQRFDFEDSVVGSGIAEIVYPLAALRGIAALSGHVEATAEAVDPVWTARLSAAVMQVRLPVRTVVARPTLPLARLLSLGPGDVIPVTLPARVPLTVSGRLLAHGTIGDANGRAAIMIEKLEEGISLDD